MTENAALAGLAGKLGISKGQVVLEIGAGPDSDGAVTAAVASVAQVVGDDYDDIVDAVLMWWRDDDGDLVDALVDALVPLDDSGVIWVMTPKAGRPGHVEPSEIAYAAPTAGLQSTSTVSAATDWQGTRLVAPKSRR